MRVVRFYAENIKRIRVVEIVPKDASMVVIGGENDAGKSSCLDAIEMALGGKRHHPAEPLRRGAKAGRVLLDLGDITVTRTFTQGGGTAVVVESKAGKTFPSPQAMLDKLYGALTFDPLEFERQDAEKQAAILRQLVGLDFSDLDKLREKLYGDRTLENKTLAMLEASLAGMEHHEDAPEAEISVQALSAELAAAEALAGKAQEAASAYAGLRGELEARRQGIQAAEAAVARLESQLAAERRRLDESRVAADAADTRLEEAAEAARAAKAAVPDTAPLHARLEEAEGLNEKVRANARYAAQEE